MAHISTAGSLAPAERVASRFNSFEDIDAQLIRCDIVFGMPSQDCRGTGICKITSDVFRSADQKKNCRHTIAFAGRTAGGNKISLFFLRELLCINLFRDQFRNGVFEMPEACALPEDMAAALNLQGSALMPGTYRIVEKDNCFRVDIDCGN